MGITAAITLAVAGGVEQHKAQKSQQKAAKEQRAVARAEAIKERRSQIRQRRIALGAATNEAFVSGGEGSILSGATSSASTQFGSNTGFINATERRNERAFKFQKDASRHAGLANIFNTGASLAASGVFNRPSSGSITGTGAPVTESIPTLPTTQRSSTIFG